jgi:amino-acid N-acetyltransferase
MEVGRATAGDLPAIETLLSTAGLPLDGAAVAFEAGVVGRDRDRLVAAAAVERYDSFGLLRSVVVAADRRGTHLGRTIVAAAEALARELGVNELFLLTETAVDWFPRLGYVPVARDQVPDVVRGSVEFTTACSVTAVAMRRSLRTA